MTDNVLIPTDGSDRAKDAVEYGLDLAEAYGTKVHVLYVVETKANYILTVELSDEEFEEYEEYGEQVVTEVVDRAADRGLAGTGSVKTGRVPEEIIEYADENDIDHIVMGKQGHGAIEKYLGGTAEKVMRMAGIPVTVLGPAAR
ncbi:universal stress protein [Halobacteriales archaeon QH_2_65_14]|nr:MAG: universal stress protein [Halobacteriales archaeon QH_2_65_14]